jgi:hypothetical protein
MIIALYGEAEGFTLSILLRVTRFVRRSVNKKTMGISRYITQKNRLNTPNLLDQYNLYYIRTRPDLGQKN